MQTLTFVLAAALAVDFNADLGKIRPELHSSGFGPTICSQTAKDLADVKAMGFKAARTHDWALINPNQRVCDYFHIFPMMQLDATDPKNYVFGPTDYLLRRTREELGLDVFYRLGTSIEHSGNKIHFNASIPEDFDKVAEIFAGTVRHYNRGWANGYNWNIKYWEIWNEPDGTVNMWCLPEGDLVENGDKAEQARRNKKRLDLFCEFYVKCLRRLKSEFGDEIKVGGPALCCYNEAYFRALLDACKKEGVAPDFISWHGYTNDSEKFVREAERARMMCDGYGFTKCELIINEWHYFGANYSWDDMQRCSDPAVKARIWEGPDSHNGIRSTAFTLATLARLHTSKLDQAYYYGCSHTGSWGFKDALQKHYKVFHGLKLFGSLMRDYTTISDCKTVGTVTTFAVKNAAGRKALLAVDYQGGPALRIDLDVKGVTKCVRGTLLDTADDGMEFKPCWDAAKGKLSLFKRDFGAAVFLVEFE